MAKDPLPTSALTGPLSHSTGLALARGRLSLLVYHRGGGEMVPLRPGVGLVLGREPPADIVLREDSLSRRHARFTLAEGEVIVEDLGSTNGTRVNGEPITRAVVRPGQEVLLGALVVCVHALAAPDVSLGLDRHDAFLAAVESEIARARYFKRPMAVLAVRAPKGPDSHVSRFWPRVQALLRPVDRASFHRADTVDILLPEQSFEQALSTAKRIADSTSGTPHLLCGVAAFPGAASQAEPLLEAANVAALSATPQSPVVPAAIDGTHVLPPRAPPPGRGPREPRAGDGASDGASAAEGADTGGPVIRSAATRAVFDMAARVARSVIPVLLQGETGTGKEIVARAIHEGGPRSARPLICVNCGAIPEPLVESTLFGHEAGAFTGAVKPHNGVFQAAHGGTVLLDEVGELSPAAQAKLLRTLETKRVTRVGATKEIEVNVRILAATHRDLEAMCATGTFRQDLLYRLNAVTLALPPLRERREDIPPLAARFLEEANRANDVHLAGFDPEATALLEAYAWPGNVRELRNVVERAAVMARGEVITTDDLPDRIRASVGEPPLPARTAAPVPPQESAGDGDYASRMARLEAGMLLAALRDSGWNQTATARALQMPLRTLQYKIKRHGLRK